MVHRTSLAVLAVGLLVASSFVGAAAFTSATVDRDVNANVVADQNGIIGLVDGNSGGIVAQKSNGELTIDFDVDGSGLGANVNSTYELGDPSDPTNATAFKIVNQDTVDHTINLEYSGFNDNSTSGAQIEYQVYDSSGSSVVTISDESTTGSFTATAGKTYYVVVVVDTTGLTKNEDLSGTLSITAT